jgi:2-polyprenyl-3-methyl-5-hydroxy-6-metoxy-1,4-benzoquinol methylase
VRFTGERLPEGDRLFEADLARHLAAYLVARPYCAGRAVLDAGCGEGYGAALVAEVAASVVGVDRSAAALARARARHGSARVRFACVDLERLDALRARFDVVLNFQVLEHLADPRRLLAQLAAHVVPGGVLVLTTPNRPMSVPENPYHVHEYMAEELRAVLAPYFGRVEVRGVAGNAKVTAYEEARRREVARILRLDPFGLRNRLPAPVVRFAFARLAKVVRRNVARNGRSADIAPEDFREQATPEGAVDLLALCWR